VRECLAPERISRVAGEGDEVLGWVGGLQRYRGHFWEVHPLVVKSERQQQGIGRALVADLEERVLERGAHTVFLGADYLLYPDVLQAIRDAGRHQYEFYQKLGYVIVGVVPDANGFGNIYMAKRIGPAQPEGAKS